MIEKSIDLLFRSHEIRAPDRWDNINQIIITNLSLMSCIKYCGMWYLGYCVSDHLNQLITSSVITLSGLKNKDQTLCITRLLNPFVTWIPK
jgi:hypothetical protein